MFKLYVGDGLTLAQVGIKVEMNPETIRRILLDQSGSRWAREFVDPATGERVEVVTTIPRLLTNLQIAQVRRIAKANQAERAGWKQRKRGYPLGGLLRCANPDCGWSNLSGHQTYDSRSVAGMKRDPVPYAYYIHLPRTRSGADCLRSVPAQQLEDEIMSRLGQFLKSTPMLTAAVRAAMDSNTEDVERLRDQRAGIEKQLKSDRRVLGNALEVLFENKGKPAASLAQSTVERLNASIAEAETRLGELKIALERSELPADLPERFELAMARLSGLNGHMPLHWPYEAQRALVEMFFGGRLSTRFDRAGKNIRSDARGIFIRKIEQPGDEPYWAYEARGSIGDFDGALTRIVSIYDAHTSERSKGAFPPEELRKLATMSEAFLVSPRFRSSPLASRPRFASACRGTSPRA